MPRPKRVPCTRLAASGSSLPKVAGPNVDFSGCGAIAAYADFARSIVENYGRAVHFPLEGIEPLSRRWFHLAGVAHRYFFQQRGERGWGAIINHACRSRRSIYLASLQSLTGRVRRVFGRTGHAKQQLEKPPKQVRRLPQMAMGGGLHCNRGAPRHAP